MNTTYIRTAIALLFLTSFSLSIFAEESANEDAGNNLKNGYVHTPVACELGRYGDVPVSLFTGTADISIPLYTTEQHGVPFQISLSYDTRGIQICSLPTWVGQGWSLTAGGVINRVVKGAPDEYIIPKHIQEGLNGNFTNYFHCYSRLDSLIEECKEGDLKVRLNTELSGKDPNSYDYSPDIFYFNFCGKNGRFLLGNDGEWKVYCEENLDIIFNVSDSNNYIEPFIKKFPKNEGECLQPKTIKGFTIVDQNGTKYHFGNNTEAIEYSTPKYGIHNTNNTIPWTANSWFLTKIEDRFNNVLYDLHYKRGPFITQAYKKNGVNSGLFDANITSPVYLDYIKTFDGQFIIFEIGKAFSTDSTCYGYNFLPNILGRESGTASNNGFDFLVKTDSPGHKYFFGQGSGENPFLSTGLCYLKKISISGKGGKTETCLDYNRIGPMMFLVDIRQKGLESDLGRYKLIYNHLQDVPLKYFSSSTDNSGFWLSNTSCSSGKKTNGGNSFRPEEKELDANSHPSIDLNKKETCEQDIVTEYKGMLSDIIYPTGGVCSLEYEQNRYSHSLSFLNPQETEPEDSEHYGYGLRIKKITTYNDSTKQVVLSQKSYKYGDGILFESINGGILTASYLPLTNSFGPKLGYRQASEIDAYGTTTSYLYSSPHTKNGAVIKPDQREESYTNTTYIMDSDISFYYGKLLGQTIKSKDSVLLYEQKNEYICNLNQFVYSFDANNYSLTEKAGGDGSFHIYKEYYTTYKTSWSQVSTSYGDVMQTIHTKYQYGYDTLHLRSPYAHHTVTHNCKSKSSYIFNPKHAMDTLKEEFTYGTQSRAYLFKPLVQTIVKHNGIVVSKKTDWYRKDACGDVLSCQIDNTFDKTDTLVYYLKYNQYGQPLVIKQKGLPNTYLDWDSKTHQLKAIVTSPKPISLFDISLFQNVNTDATLITYSNQLISSITQGSGITTYYEFDDANRLTAVKDFNRNSKSCYRYQFQNGDYSENYIETEIHLDPSGSKNNVSRQYYDGIGRPWYAFSNAFSTPDYSLYSLTEYNQNGLVEREWCPVAFSSNKDIQPMVIKEQSSQFYSDTCSFCLKEYDSLGRLTREIKPGQSWQNKKTVKALSINQEPFRIYSADSDSRLDSIVSPAGSLIIETLTDEDGTKSSTYKDFYGNTVLERRYNGHELQDTYYAYNEKGQLVYVLQPKYQKDPNLSKYAFQYTYDERGRVKTKKLPGCNPIEYWYDNADRIIKMQDGLLRETGKFRTYEYDALGRMVKQSISNGSRVLYDEIINYYDTDSFLDAYGTMTYRGPVYYLLRSAHKHSYLLGTKQRASNGEELLTTFAYDDYGRVCRKGEIGLNKQLTITDYTYNFVGDVTSETTETFKFDEEDGSYDNILEASITNKYEAPHTNLLTSSLLKVWEDNSSYLMTDTIQKLTYDDFGHIIGNNRSGTAADMSYAYDNLHGWTKQIKSAGGFEQNLYRETEGATPRWNGSISAMTWQTDDSKVHRYDYTYDGMNRLTKADYTSKIIPQQIVQESRGRSIFDPIISPGIIPANNVKSPLPSQLSLNNLQAFIPESEFTNLTIEQTEEPAAVASRSASTSGMISQQRPKVGPYDYTKQHGNYSELVEYDANTNITSLQRYGMKNDKSFGLIDDLSISHNGNQISSVSDAVDESLDYEGAFDFADGDDKNKEYSYNGNGALTMDLNKGIDNIEYDLLGNPIKLTIDNNTKRIEYVYAADGRRLKTKHSYITYVTKPRLHREIFSDSTEYVGNLILKNGKPSMYQFSGGYYSFDGDKKPECHYYIQDYQGNNRMVVNARTNEVEQTTHYYPYGGIIGNLSSNQEAQKYKYSGKELDRTYGLDLYDFHARLFNPALPVFDRPDPLAEDFTWLTPYNYCAGNPVNCIDPDGMKVIMINGYYPVFSETGNARYWKGTSVARLANKLRQSPSQEILYKDGSIGSKVFNYGGKSLSSSNRFNKGRKAGEREVADLVENLERNEKGLITESLYVITHSMGAAYAKGYLTSVMEYIKDKGLNVNVIEIDFAPHQPTEQTAVDGVTTYQVSHSEDVVVDDSRWMSTQGDIKGAIQVDASADEDQGHSIDSFNKSVEEIQKKIIQ